MRPRHNRINEVRGRVWGLGSPALAHPIQETVAAGSAESLGLALPRVVGTAR